jgi:predicted aconitase with swiveling domain
VSAAGEVREIRGRGIVHGTAIGIALVSPEPFSFLGDLDIRTGMVVNRTSSIRGQSVGGRVLVLPVSVGSAGAWRFLYQLFVHGTNPVAIVTRALPDSSLVQGAILAGVPVVCDPGEDVLSMISTGDTVEVDGTTGLIRVRTIEGVPDIGS